MLRSLKNYGIIKYKKEVADNEGFMDHIRGHFLAYGLGCSCVCISAVSISRKFLKGF